MYDINFASDMIQAIDSHDSMAAETNKVWCDAALAIGREFLGYKADPNQHPEELEELLVDAYQLARQEMGLEDKSFSASEIWQLLISKELEAAHELFAELYYDDDEKVLDMLEGEDQEALAEIVGDLVNNGYWHIASKYLNLPAV